MDEPNYFEAFNKLLYKKGAKELFYKNLDKDFVDLTVEDMVSKVVSPELWLENAFLWATSPENEKYWDNINKEWTSLLTKGNSEVEKFLLEDISSKVINGFSMDSLSAIYKLITEKDVIESETDREMLEALINIKRDYEVEKCK